MWIVLAPELKLDRPENMIIFLHFSRMTLSINTSFSIFVAWFTRFSSQILYIRKLLYFNIDSYSSLSVNMRYQDLFSCFPHRTIILVLLFLYSLQIFQSWHSFKIIFLSVYNSFHDRSITNNLLLSLLYVSSINWFYQSNIVYISR